MFLNLCAGLDRMGVGYRVNDFGHIRRAPKDLACIVGKPFLLDQRDWKNPILFGAAVYSHPVDAPDLLDRFRVVKVLVPGEWMRRMCEPYLGEAVAAWPVGIDVDLWAPTAQGLKTTDVLLYNKVRWDYAKYEQELLEPIRARLSRDGASFVEFRYGGYREEEFLAALSRCRSMIFLCEHETQGIAYQQALSAGVPILAWDRGGEWRDPSYHPHKVRFGPVTSVPYWDERCGLKFSGPDDFGAMWDEFWEAFRCNRFQPRNYILENLTLEKCAAKYLEFARSAAGGAA